MDLESTMETVVSYLPENMGLSGILIDTTYYIPTQLDFITAMKFLLLFAGAALILSILGRFVLGKHSSLNHSLSCAMGILAIYAVTIVIYCFRPLNLEDYITPLPFITFHDKYLLFLQFDKASIPLICHEVLSLVILAFLINLIDTLIPSGKSLIGWYCLRFLTVILSMSLHYLVRWGFETYLPDVLVTYAPTILLFVLLAMVILGFMNGILSIFLIVVNPVIGALYTFFFSNAIGKQVTKAFFTSAILIAIVYALDYFGYSVICISAASLIGYIPLLMVALILWYLIGHLL